MAQLLPAEPRLRALTLWRTETRFADAIIARLLPKQNSLARSRFALGIIYGAHPNLTLLDFWIDCLRSAIWMSIFAMSCGSVFTNFFVLDTPPHAAVFRNSRARRQETTPHRKCDPAKPIRQRDELFARARPSRYFCGDRIRNSS